VGDSAKKREGIYSYKVAEMEKGKGKGLRNQLIQSEFTALEEEKSSA